VTDYIISVVSKVLLKVLGEILNARFKKRDENKKKR